MLKYSFAILLVLVVGASAAIDNGARAIISAIQKGSASQHQIQDLRVQDDAVIGDDLAVGGDANFDGVVTLVSAPVLTEITASGTATALMTNAPAITEETPVWATVTYGTNEYVVPLWLKD